jgi:hypothetical protein
MSYMAAVDVAPSVAMGMSQVRTQAIRLFAVGFLVLFMELACIRWFATYVIFLQFFTSVILIASFLGMSCGCLAAGRRQEWLHYFPLIGLGAIVAALAASTAYHFWSGLVIDAARAIVARAFIGRSSQLPPLSPQHGERESFDRG